MFGVSLFVIWVFKDVFIAVHNMMYVWTRKCVSYQRRINFQNLTTFCQQLIIAMFCTYDIHDWYIIFISFAKQAADETAGHETFTVFVHFETLRIACSYFHFLIFYVFNFITISCFLLNMRQENLSKSF